MLLSSLLLLVYTFCASASWVFNHEYDLETRSWVSNSLNNARSQYTRRQDDPENISVAGGPGHGPCRPGDRNCCRPGDKHCCRPGDKHCCRPGDKNCCRPGDKHCCRPGDKHCNPHPTTTRTTTRTTATTTSTKTTTTTTSHPTATPCAGNTPSTRSQWCSHSISTDYHSITPNTGITREYWLEVDEMIGSPDGFPRHVFAINGTIPGPTLYADWGDNLVIHVRNHMHETLNGTSIHWHGIRQQNSNMDDGVVSITQCPITPNDEYTYRWRAQQYGTSWYHSHMGLQAWDGVAGGLVINGPATANYDHDAGVVMLSDWTHQTADELFWVAQVSGPPELSNVLINGTNVYGGSGERFKLKVERGESYRLRLVNGALDTHFKFMIDHHVLEVIAMDLVPVKPFVVESVSLAMGQRYDVIVHANQAAIADSFWLRAIPQQACSEIENKDIWGIFYYGDTPTEPTTSPFLFNDTCQDEPMDSLIPYVPRTVQPPDWQENTLATVGRNPQNLFRWFLNSTSMLVYWEDPTLLQIADGDNVYAESSAVIDLPNGDEWVYLIVNTTIPVSHPIHLHGHDFFILAQGTNPWDGVVKLDNPPRRDTAVLPGNGYLVMAWETDNPGAWLMHCHIGWHTTEGFALQFVERKEEILSVIDEGELRRQCEKWSGYDVEFEVEQHDSGV